MDSRTFFLYIFRSIIYTYFISGLLLLICRNLLPYSGYGLYTRYDPCARKNTHKITIYVKFLQHWDRYAGNIHMGMYMFVYVHYVMYMINWPFLNPSIINILSWIIMWKKFHVHRPFRPFIIFSIDNKQKPSTPRSHNDCKIFCANTRLWRLIQS